MLHPQCRALLDRIAASGLPSLDQMSVHDARQTYLERRFVTQPDAPVGLHVTDLEADGQNGPIGLRCYRPSGSTLSGATLPVLVYFHGGGWTIGDLDTHDTLCRQLAEQADCAVIAVDYRMGPEHRFPAAVDDCIAALQYISAHAGELAIDPHRLAVGGDSAGGNLAAVCAIHARDCNGPAIAYQLLIYPATDQSNSTPSYVSNGQGYLLTAATMRYFHDHYIDDERFDRDWRASPLLAADLSGLPPALVLTAGFDPLRDEGLAYADRLSASGVSCSYLCFERQIHGFMLMGRVLDEANTAVSLCAAALKTALKISQMP
jgi:acetyl esterase